MIDIVTVVFEPELPVLKTQASSLEKYCPDVNDIYVLVNDHDGIADRIDPAWWGDLADRVTIIPRSQFNCAWSSNGWVSQQALKLLGPTLCRTPWVMVLDAKTVFIRELRYQDIFDSQGRVKCGWSPTITVFNPAQDIANRLFGSQSQDTLRPMGVPFFFHRDLMIELLEYIRQSTQQHPIEWFQEQGMLTEFVLYSTWVEHKFGKNSDYYCDPDRDWLVPCNICHNEVGIFDAKLDQINDSTLTVSVHRRAWEQITDTQKSRFNDLLQRRGITCVE